MRFLFAVLMAAMPVWAQPAGLDAWVERARATFDVPGIAVAIVKDGKPVVLKGYGVRRLGDAAAVDAKTLFGIASNTKAFTAAALAILVDEGKVRWDDPVQKHLPSFQLADALVTRELTVRDLLCHRSGLGLGAGDLLYWPDTKFTRDQVLAAARHIAPASSFRSRYAYNNLMFVVAGEVVRAASGLSYDEFVKQRIFAPAGMKSSRITSVGLGGGENFAAPHSRGWRLEGAPLQPIAMTKDDTWAAAAGVRSNVEDLARWVGVQLGRGEMEGGKRLFSEAASREMWAPQTIIAVSDPPAALAATKANFAAYGLGWSLRDYKGRKLVSHGGALTGMVSRTLLVPEEGLGIVILTNQEESAAMASIEYHILDHYLQLPAADWIGLYAQQREERMKRAREAEQKQEQARRKDTRPSLEWAKYAGAYQDGWYGKVSVKEAGGKLTLDFEQTPGMVADLAHWHHDTFKAVFRDTTIPDAWVTFAIDRRAEVSEIRMEATSPLADFSFDYQDLTLRRQRSGR
ncbi:MAG TPA: serine hydrolase [Solibacterales bacterium]|nr:serine hydrolase [Bryobacterales bacterium]